MSAPIFTKRHYRFIARAINDALRATGILPADGDMIAEGTARTAAEQAAAALRGTNPAFDEERFVLACLDGCDTARANTTHRSPIR